MPVGQQVTSWDIAIAELDGGPWYRRREVAALLGVTPGAILQLGNSPLHPELAPRHWVTLKNRRIYLWTDLDIQELRKHFKRRNAGAGRPAVFTPDESVRRRRQSDLARYYRGQVRRYNDAGDLDAAAYAQIKADAIQGKLDKELVAKNGRVIRRSQPRLRSPGATVSITEDERRELEHLRAISEDYRVSLQALAVVTERLLTCNSQGVVVISEDQLKDSPDLIAQRDPQRGRLRITVSR